ncbi:hypothetical protein [Marinobacter sp. VGCF2001]|uniref:hypothetical protein n=1 Tax=Marinobacter sp. VGCF2001 TaxID=3417189 RepID=UPI003CEACE1A
MAETQSIEGFHDPDNAFVGTPDGSFVPARELGLKLPIKIRGKAQGQYLFEGPGGGTYRVFVPEVITSGSRQPVIHCEKSQVVFADDHKVASARGMGEGCP